MSQLPVPGQTSPPRREEDGRKYSSVFHELAHEGRDRHITRVRYGGGGRRGDHDDLLLQQGDGGRPGTTLSSRGGGRRATGSLFKGQVVLANRTKQADDELAEDSCIAEVVDLEQQWGQDDFEVVLRGCDGTRFRVPASTNVEAHWASGRERRILAAAMRQDPEAVVEAMLDGRDELDIPEGVGLLFLVACFNLVAAPVPEFRLAAGGPRSSSDAVAAAGGLAFCLSIVDGYPYSRRIQLNGLRALGSVADGSPQHATSVYAAGGLPIVFRALDLHQDHPGTLERAAFAIGAVIGKR